MLSVKGTFQNGVAQPAATVEGREGEPVIITFIEEQQAHVRSDDAAWEELLQLLERCAVDTGISDLAEQHDHYLYGTPKKD
jgi:hypothetical protein